MLYIFTQKTKFLHFQPKIYFHLAYRTIFDPIRMKKKPHDFGKKISAIV